MELVRAVRREKNVGVDREPEDSPRKGRGSLRKKKKKSLYNHTTGEKASENRQNVPSVFRKGKGKGKKKTGS